MERWLIHIYQLMSVCRYWPFRMDHVLCVVRNEQAWFGFKMFEWGDEIASSWVSIWQLILFIADNMELYIFKSKTVKTVVRGNLHQSPITSLAMTTCFQTCNYNLSEKRNTDTNRATSNPTWRNDYQVRITFLKLEQSVQQIHEIWHLTKMDEPGKKSPWGVINGMCR